MTNDTLASLVRRRIDSKYDGNQAAFAREMQVSPQSITAILKENVTLPHTAVRRRLAKELGIPHVQFFVMAGELLPEELEAAGVQGVIEDGPRAHVHAIVDQHEWTQENANRVVQIIQTWVPVADKE